MNFNRPSVPLYAVFAFFIILTVFRGAPAHAQTALQAQGDLPGPGDGGVYAIRTSADWQTFQQERGLTWAINIDFNRDMVIAVFLGTRNSAGYKIELAEIRAEPWHAEVTYREIPPSATTPVAQMLTNPYILKVIGQSQTPVVFSKGFFSTVHIPYGEFSRLVHHMSETDYRLQDERRLKELAEGRVRDLSELLTRNGPHPGQ